MSLTAKGYLAYAMASGSAGAALSLPNWSADATLRALGIALPLVVLLPGVLFAIAGAFLRFAIDPPERKMTLWVALFAGALIGVLMLALQPSLPVVRDMPVIAVAIASGYTSRSIARRLAEWKPQLPLQRPPGDSK